MFQETWYQIGRSIVHFYVNRIMRADVQHDCPWPAGAKIIAANHPSTNDPAFVTTLTNEKATILIKDTLFKVPLFGRSLRMAGHVPVVAGNGRAALEEGIRLLKAGKTVMIFPEGEISPEGGLNHAHTGVARLALATGAPVIPVGISLDARRVRLVHTMVEGKSEVGTWYLQGPYAMTAGRPVHYAGSLDNYEQVRQVTDEIMNHIAMLSRRGDHRLARRVAAGRALRLGMASPTTAMHVAWRGTWTAFCQSARLALRSPIVRAVESGLVMLLMYARHF